MSIRKEMSSASAYDAFARRNETLAFTRPRGLNGDSDRYCRRKWIESTSRKPVLHLATLLVVMFMAFATRSTAQALPITKIIHARQGNYEMPVRVRGAITIAPNLSNRGQSSRMQIQDDTAGISVLSADQRLVMSELQLGDVVEVAGTVRHHDGRLLLELSDFVKIGSGARLVPIEVTVSELLVGRHPGRVVKLAGNLYVPTDAHPERVRLRDSTGEIGLVVPSRFFRNPDFAEDFQSAESVQVLGIVLRAQTGPAQILVQDASDIRFSPKPPYQVIALTISLLTVSGTFLHLLQKRRSAERHSSETALILDQLRVSEQHLRQSEEQYRSLFENANDLIYTVDLNGRITSVNTATERVTGYDRQELLGSSSEILLAPEHLPVARQMKQRIFGGETAATVFEADFMTKNDRRVQMELSSQLTHALGVPVGIQTVARDITERNRMQRELHQTRKMEALGRIAGGVAHDFNNILTVIGGFNAMIADHSDDSVRASTSAIQTAVNRAVALTRQLLAFGRKQVLQPKILNLNQVIVGMEKLLPRLVREDIFLITQLLAELWPVEADAVQLEQIIMNLMVNARDAMPDGGNLSIETANVARCDHVDASGSHPDSLVALIVRDSGCGMNSETLAHIFEPFFTTKAPQKGTGLGLATVYGIVEQSGGHIHVHSELLEGTTFEIHFPRAFAAVEKVKAAASNAHQQRVETILFVEDDPQVRHVLSYYLSSYGYRTLEAAGPHEALELCKSYSGPLDLMLTDVIMPQMNGPLLAEKATEIRPAMKVVYMSGYTDDTMGHHRMLKESVSFIEKPFTADSLDAKLRECLKRIN